MKYFFLFFITSVALLTAQTEEPYTRTIQEVRVVKKNDQLLTFFRFSGGMLWFNLQPLDPLWTTGTEVQIDIPLHNDRFFRLTTADGKLLPVLPVYNRLPQIAKLEWLDSLSNLSQSSPATLQITLTDGALFQVQDCLGAIEHALAWQVGNEVFVSRQLYPLGHYVLSVSTTKHRSSLRHAQLLVPPTPDPTPLPEIETTPLSNIPNCTLLQELKKQLKK